MNLQKFLIDEVPVAGFFYSIVEKQMKLFYTEYFDPERDYELVKVNCILTIENWSKAVCSLDSGQELFDLDFKIGVILEILSSSFLDDTIELFGSTMDGRYLSIKFHQATYKFEINNE